MPMGQKYPFSRARIRFPCLFLSLPALSKYAVADRRKTWPLVTCPSPSRHCHPRSAPLLVCADCLDQETPLHHQSMSRQPAAGAGTGAGSGPGASADVATATAPVELQMYGAFAACKFEDFTIRKVRRRHPHVCVCVRVCACGCVCVRQPIVRKQLTM